jgi:glutathione peroxidase
MKLAVIALFLAAGAGERAVTIDHEMKSITGESVKLSSYRGRALLIVNVASECGYTPQYEGLQQLWEKYRDRGLTVIGVPSNDFGGQEPGTEAEIQSFCKVRYGVTFPLMAKVHARGPDIAPLFRTLTQEIPGLEGEVKWNFAKFLVDPEGKPVARFGSRTEPMSKELTAAIEKVLPKK